MIEIVLIEEEELKQTGGWGNNSVGTVIDVQAWPPDFRPSACTFRHMPGCNPSNVEQGQKDPGGPTGQSV